jgi:hypothetical protein
MNDPLRKLLDARLIIGQTAHEAYRIKSKFQRYADATDIKHARSLIIAAWARTTGVGAECMRGLPSKDLAAYLYCA